MPAIPLTSCVVAALVAALCCLPLPAAADGETVEYRHGDVTLEGYLVAPSPSAGRCPGILLVHDWDGIDDYERLRAEMLAELGYVALAADIYGKGVRPADTEQAAAESSKYKNDPALYRARLAAGLDTLRRNPRVDPDRLGAIGYCFGGTGVLELARSGADVKGVVSFHGSLGTSSPATPGSVKAAILVLHGGADPVVPPDEVSAFVREMLEAGANFSIVSYPGAVHAFTKYGSRSYHQRADRASWEAMKRFFADLFTRD